MTIILLLYLTIYRFTTYQDVRRVRIVDCLIFETNVSNHANDIVRHQAMTFIGKRIRFELLRTTVIALRGEREG